MLCPRSRIAMGWDFTATPYEEAAWTDVAATARQGLAAVKARLEAEVPPAERSRSGLQGLEGAFVSSWHRALFLVLAARGPGVFLGRSVSVGTLAGLADEPLDKALSPLQDAR